MNILELTIDKAALRRLIQLRKKLMKLERTYGETLPAPSLCVEALCMALRIVENDDHPDPFYTVRALLTELENFEEREAQEGQTH